MPWFMRHDDQVERFRIFVGDYLERSEENLRELDALQQALDSGAPPDLTPENELASLFIHALETGTERELPVNIRNGGLIASLPDECCVEVPCLVGAGGPKPCVRSRTVTRPSGLTWTGTARPSTLAGNN